jgi:hypothetical protein
MLPTTSHSALYEDDILAWSEDQAEALRRLAAEMRPNSRDLDFDNIIEEIGEVGRAQLETVLSQIVNILTHWLMGAFDPDAPSVPHWQAEVQAFLTRLLLAYAPSMRQRIEMDWAWRRALRTAEPKLAAYGARLPDGLPDACPFSLDELLDPDFSWDQATTRLRASLTASPE